MTQQQATKTKRIIYGLIVLGFAGLIGAHEIAPADDNADMTWPLILAGAGTLCFVVAGLMARKLMRQIASK